MLCNVTVLLFTVNSKSHEGSIFNLYQPCCEIEFHEVKRQLT